MKQQLRLFDTWSRSVRDFQPIVPGKVGIYTCGPTVYDYAHLGNLRTYLFEDGLIRVLRMHGFDVNHVMNITDVGHLVSDGNDGEDKMEVGSRRTGQSAWTIAALYTDAFRADMRALNIREPSTWCKATDHINEQIAFIQRIEERGYTYVTSDGIYFDTSKQPEYGFYLGLNGIEAQQPGVRVDMGEKQSAGDYVLWKFPKPGENRQMEWDSPWGRGFPGWHIECSAMAHKYLGEYFDIHCGGEDHIGVHHRNEISQTEAAYNSRLSNYWMHGYFLVVDDAKMSKSAGKTLRVQLLVDQGYDPLAYRYLCMTAHYRTQLNFSWEALEAAQIALERLRRTFHALPPVAADNVASAEFERLQQSFLERLANDLNFPQALVVLREAVRSTTLSGSELRALLTYFDQALGLGLTEWQPKANAIPAHITELAQARWNAKAARDWTEADRLRDQLETAGWTMQEHRDTFELTPVS